MHNSIIYFKNANKNGTLREMRWDQENKLVSGTQRQTPSSKVREKLLKLKRKLLKNEDRLRKTQVDDFIEHITTLQLHQVLESRSRADQKAEKNHRHSEQMIQKLDC